MGEYRIIISDLAKQDIRDTASHITNNLRESEIANKLTGTIIDAIFTLEDMPLRVGFVRDERLANMQVRGLQVKNYTAFFRVDETSKIVEIIRVLYSRRDWPSLL